MSVLKKVLEHAGKPWFPSWMEIQRNVGIISEFSSKKLLQKTMVGQSEQINILTTFVSGYTLKSIFF